MSKALSKALLNGGECRESMAANYSRTLDSNSKKLNRRVPQKFIHATNRVRVRLLPLVKERHNVSSPKIHTYLK